MSDISDTEVDLTISNLRAEVVRLQQKVQALEVIQDKYYALKKIKNNLDKSLAPLLEDMRAADPTLQVTRVGSEFIKNFGAFYANLKAKTANTETAAEIDSLRQELREAQQHTTDARPGKEMRRDSEKTENLDTGAIAPVKSRSPTLEGDGFGDESPSTLPHSATGI